MVVIVKVNLNEINAWNDEKLILGLFGYYLKKGKVNIERTAAGSQSQKSWINRLLNELKLMEYSEE